MFDPRSSTSLIQKPHYLAEFISKMPDLYDNTENLCYYANFLNHTNAFSKGEIQRALIAPNNKRLEAAREKLADKLGDKYEVDINFAMLRKKLSNDLDKLYDQVASQNKILKPPFFEKCLLGVSDLGFKYFYQKHSSEYVLTDSVIEAKIFVINQALRIYDGLKSEAMGNGEFAKVSDKIVTDFKEETCARNYLILDELVKKNLNKKYLIKLG